jgi:hypothetical protein
VACTACPQSSEGICASLEHFQNFVTPVQVGRDYAPAASNGWNSAGCVAFTEGLFHRSRITSARPGPPPGRAAARGAPGCPAPAAPPWPGPAAVAQRRPGRAVRVGGRLVT